MIRIMLIYYVNLYTFLEEPEKDWTKLMEEHENPPLDCHCLTMGLTFSMETTNRLSAGVS